MHFQAFAKTRTTPLGFVSWIKADTWRALGFQAYLGVGGQSKM